MNRIALPTTATTMSLAAVLACLPTEHVQDCVADELHTCVCPGGATGAEECDANGAVRCACLLEWLPMQIDPRQIALYDEGGDEIRRARLPEDIEGVPLFLPVEGLLIATQRTSDCGEDMTAFDLVTGEPVTRMTDSGSCLSGFFPSADRSRIFMLQAEDYVSTSVIKAFDLAQRGALTQAAAIALGPGYPRSVDSRAVDTSVVVVPMMVEHPGPHPSTTHQFMRVDVETGEVRELFALPATERVNTTHLTDRIYVLGLYSLDSSTPQHSVRSYDVDSGVLLQTVPGVLISSQGQAVFVRDENAQIKRWDPRLGTLSQSFGNGGWQATVAEDAVALTGMGADGLGTWVYQLSTGTRTLTYDGAMDREDGESLTASVRLLTRDGAGLLQIIQTCRGDVCNGGSAMLLRGDQSRFDFGSIAARNTNTLVMAYSEVADDPRPYRLSAIDPQTLDVSLVRGLSYDELWYNVVAPGLDVITW